MRVRFFNPGLAYNKIKDEVLSEIDRVLTNGDLILRKDVEDFEKSIAEYASEKLWKPLGAEHPAYWSTDEQGMEKVSCCWYSNARDFARLARLMMRYGNWDGNQIIDSSYAIASVKAAGDLVDSETKLPIKKYGYQWWLLEYKNHPVFFMRGIRGQYVFAIPDEHLIIVRLGHKRDPLKWNDIPVDVYFYLDVGIGL